MSDFDEGGGEWYEGYFVDAYPQEHVVYRYFACGRKDGSRSVHAEGQTPEEATAKVRAKIDHLLRMGS